MTISRARLAGAVFGSMLAAGGCVSALKAPEDSVQASAYRSLLAE